MEKNHWTAKTYLSPRTQLRISYKESMDKNNSSNIEVVSRQFFHLLPAQVMLAMVGTINAIVASLFASHYLKPEALSVIGLYAPVELFIGALNSILLSGASILYGKYMGERQVEHTRGIFSMNLLLGGVLAAVMIVFHVLFSAFGWIRIFTTDETALGYLGPYLLGKTVGLLPMVSGQQLSGFLSLENQRKRTTAAGLAYIAVNLAMSFLFVDLLRLEAFGLAMASSIGMWVFFAVQTEYFWGEKSNLKFSLSNLHRSDALEIIRVGHVSALGDIYVTLRIAIVNGLILSFVGTAGLSAYTAAASIIRFLWAIPVGMSSVYRMLISVSIGEEDRKTLTDITRVSFFRCIPLMLLVSGVVTVLAEPLTRLFFSSSADSVYGMTVWAFRIMPWCMPLSIVFSDMMCYGQATDKFAFTHLISLLGDFMLDVLFSVALIPLMGMIGFYLAILLDNVALIFIILMYSWISRRQFPKSIDDFMMIPEEFGVSSDECLDFSVHEISQASSVSERVSTFCLNKGIDARRANAAGLCLEEMVVNVINHGFIGDSGRHSVDIRVVHKGNDLLLRIRDDCVPFDPTEQQALLASEDVTRNIGLRIVFRMARSIEYRNMLGLNVLRIRL